jgi:hypothetical protein
MALSPVTKSSSFHMGVIAATTTVAMLFATNAFAQTAGKPSGRGHPGTSTADVLRAVKSLDHRIDAANRRGAAADARGAKATATTADERREETCTDSIVAMINSGAEGKERVKSALGEKSMRDVNACQLLATLTKS